MFYFQTIHSFLTIETIELSEDVKGILLLLLLLALCLQPPLAILVVHPPLGRVTQHLERWQQEVRDKESPHMPLIFP